MRTQSLAWLAAALGVPLAALAAAFLGGERVAQGETKPTEPKPRPVDPKKPPETEPPPPPQPPTLGPDAGRIRGMGITVRTLNHTRLIKGAGKYDGPALVEWCLTNNVQFVELLGAWVDKSGKVKRYLSSPKSEQVAQQLRDAGIKVGIWGWPDPVNDEGFREVMTEAAKRVGAAWIKLNPERPYHPVSGHSRAKREASALYTMDWARELGPVDITSYGSGPKSHPYFPWKEWAAGARYGRPQWYDAKSSWSAKKVASFADSWDDYFAVICPILSAVNTNTPAQIEGEAALFIPTAGGPAFSYWDFYWAAISSKRTGALREVGAKYPTGAP